MGKIETICEVCGSTFLTWPYRLRLGQSKWCSKKCRHSHTLASRIKVSCEACGIEILCFPSRIRRFCSIGCRDKIHFAGKHPLYQGTQWLNGHGYLEMTDPNTGNRVKVHRYIMEQHLGRSLLPTEDVHHRNECKTDNRILNLVVIDHGKHASLSNTISAWSRKFSCCIVCGKTETKHAGHGVCNRCRSRKKQRLKGNRVPRHFKDRGILP